MSLSDIQQIESNDLTSESMVGSQKVGAHMDSFKPLAVASYTIRASFPPLGTAKYLMRDFKSISDRTMYHRLITFSILGLTLSQTAGSAKPGCACLVEGPAVLK